MNAIEIAIPRLQAAEGFRSHKYLDSVGAESIGYGFNVTAGISQYCALELLDAQATELHAHLASFPWYSNADPARQSVALEIAFNQGLDGLLHYPHMIAAFAAHDWPLAAQECSVSTPGLQARYEKLSKILMTGDA